VFKLDWRLRSIHDVVVLLFVALPLSGIAAFLATLTRILDHVIPWNAYVKAALDWWIGDAVVIACLTPFCLGWRFLTSLKLYKNKSHQLGVVSAGGTANPIFATFHSLPKF
jgi:integral membrane sensor domain MASE1